VKEIIYFLMNIQWFRKLFRGYLNEERSPGYGESNPCQYSRLLTYEKSGLELGLAQAAGPLGNLRPGKADWPKELARRAKKSATWRGNLKIEFRSCWGLWEKGSSWSLPRSNLNLRPHFYYMNLAQHSIKGQS
jgi:hypothetical protein